MLRTRHVTFCAEPSSSVSTAPSQSCNTDTQASRVYAEMLAEADRALLACGVQPTKAQRLEVYAGCIQECKKLLRESETKGHLPDFRQALQRFCRQQAVNVQLANRTKIRASRDLVESLLLST